MRLSANEIYDRLVNVEHILEIAGQIKFYLGDVNIVVKQKDVVGNIMQEWLQGWMDARDIEYAPSENTQMPPDFFLNPDNRKKGLLEVKAFNRKGSPGFDIADFRMYAMEIQEKPYMLDVDYLIFGYDMSDDGIVTIKDIWLKKVWQITRRMENYPINLQVKEGVIHKIRPGVWYSERATDYAIFDCLEDFISAIEETTFKEPKLRSSVASTWLAIFQKNYKAWCGKELDVPRWKDVKDKYDLLSDKKIAKVREKLNQLLIRKQKIEERVVRYRQDINNANTKKKMEKVNNKLAKALIELEDVLIKIKEKREEYDILRLSYGTDDKD